MPLIENNSYIHGNSIHHFHCLPLISDRPGSCRFTNVSTYVTISFSPTKRRASVRELELIRGSNSCTTSFCVCNNSFHLYIKNIFPNLGKILSMLTLKLPGWVINSLRRNFLIMSMIWCSSSFFPKHISANRLNIACSKWSITLIHAASFCGCCCKRPIRVWWAHLRAKEYDFTLEDCRISVARLRWRTYQLRSYEAEVMLRVAKVLGRPEMPE